jgi:hypothetical protein
VPRFFFMHKPTSLTIEHPSLASISCAYLISVELFDAEENKIIGRVKKTWGNGRLKIEEKNAFSLWRPVVWDAGDIAPVEVMYAGADPSRDFKFGEQAILIEGVNGFETFLPTPHFIHKLEIIFNKKLIKEMVDTQSMEEISDWIDDPDLGPFFSDLLLKKGHTTHDDLIKKEIEMIQPFFSEAFLSVVKKLSGSEKLLVFKLLLEKSDLAQVENLSRLENFFTIDLNESELDCRLLFLKKLNSKNPLHFGAFATLMSSAFDVENLKKRPGLISVARDLWKELIMQTDREDVMAQFKIYWSTLSVTGRKNFAPLLSKAMIIEGRFYNFDFYEYLRSEMRSCHDPYYFELLKPIWSDARFYKDENNRSVVLSEDLMELAKDHSFFIPLSQLYQETMVLLKA